MDEGPGDPISNRIAMAIYYPLENAVTPSG
jgi:hypothetical protein